MTANKILRNFLVYRNDDFYAIVPTICRANNGDLLVGFRRQPNRKKDARLNLHIDTDSHVALVRSRDQGQSWSEAQTLPRTPGVGQQSAQLTRLSNGRIILGSFHWEVVEIENEEIVEKHWFMRGYHRLQKNNPWKGIFKMTGAIICHSDDDGHTFTNWRPVTVPPPYIEGLCAIEGKIAELPDGRLLLPVYAMTGRILSYPSLKSGFGYCALCLVSDDGGETFSFLAPVAQNPDPKGQGFDEHSFCVLANGDLVSFHRATGDPQDCVWLSRSVDQGKSWHLERLNGVIGHPTKGVRLSDGRVLMVYGYRHLPGAGVRMRILDPDCRRIAQTPEVIVRDDALPAGHSVDEGISFDFGYPDAVELEPGRVLVVYYFPDPVSDCRIEGSILSV